MIWTIENWYSESRVKAAAERVYFHNSSELSMAHLAEVCPALSAAERAHRLVEFHRQRMEAVPRLTRYPELRGMRELVGAEQRGIQDGAGFDETQLATYCSGGVYAHRLLHSQVDPSLHSTVTANCSYIFFPDSDHGPLLANNLNSSTAELFGPPQWPTISEHLIFGGVSSGIFLDELSPEIFPVPVTKLVARYCRTAREAVEMLSRYNYFWGPGNSIVIDQDHMARSFTREIPPVEHTLRTIIWKLREQKAVWWARKDGKPSFLNPQPLVEFSGVL